MALKERDTEGRTNGISKPKTLIDVHADVSIDSYNDNKEKKLE